MKPSPLKYAELACTTMMQKFAANALPPVKTLFYHQGVFLSGMERVYKLTGNKQYFQYIKGYIDSVIGPNGEICGIDHEFGHIATDDLSVQNAAFPFAGKEMTYLDCKQPVILMYNLLEETGDIKYRRAIETISRSMYYWPVNRYGGYWHMMHQHNQMWMDGAYMAGPLSVMYANHSGDSTLRERAVKQIFIMHEHIRDAKTGLYFHGWDPTMEAAWADSKTGLSKNIWGRALGWYAVAILDILDHIPKDHSAVKGLKQIEQELLDALRKYQDPKTGMWYQVTDKPGAEGNWIESSCSNLFIYSYAKAMRLGIIPRDGYEDILRKAYEGSTDSIYYDEKGNLVVDNVCVGTCIEDGSYEHYIHRKCTQNDLHGMGAFVLMCCEMELWNRWSEEHCAAPSHS